MLGITQMKKTLLDNFPKQFNTLNELFKGNITEETKTRLNNIFMTCEEKWEDNLRRLHKPIKYLLIGEAPPWTEKDKVRYFYNTFDGNWVRRIWRVFFQKSPSNDVDKCLSGLAEKQF